METASSITPTTAPVQSPAVGFAAQVIGALKTPVSFGAAIVVIALAVILCGFRVKCGPFEFVCTGFRGTQLQGESVSGR